MINKSEIENKDFSMTIPVIITKLITVSESLQIRDDRRDWIDNEVMEGFGLILEDVIDDLRTINKALYWSDEPKEKPPEAAEQASTD